MTAVATRRPRTPAETALMDSTEKSRVTVQADELWTVSTAITDCRVEVCVSNDPDADVAGAQPSRSVWLMAADARILAAALVRYADELDTPYLTGEVGLS